MRLQLISCDLFRCEVQAAAARSPNRIDTVFLKKPSHQLTEPERVSRLQALIHRARRARYHAVLVAAGSCQGGLAGLRAGSIPLVLPRARDCLSLVLEQSSGTVPPALDDPSALAPPGWVAASRAVARRSGRPSTPQHVTPGHKTLSQIASCLRYSGLQDSLLEAWKWRRHLPGDAPDSSLEPQPARRPLTLLGKMVDGYWNYPDFVVVPPGWQVVVDQDRGVIDAEEIPL
jgi:hypothetical protein